MKEIKNDDDYNLGYIYIISSPLLKDIVKIGMWTGLLNKLRSRYVTYYGSSLHIWSYFTSNVNKVEKNIKNVFRDYNVTNELFLLSHLSEYKEYVKKNCVYINNENLKDGDIVNINHQNICKHIKTIAGHRFVYTKLDDNNYRLYCYNGKYWQNGTILLKKFISTELHDYIKNIIVEHCWESEKFWKLKNNLDKLKNNIFKKNVVETYKEYGINNDIKFDDKWWLFGFNNVVYDFKAEKFREYKYDDYVSTTCSYDWREPTENEISTVNDILKSIIPIEENRELYLRILCTALEGRSTERVFLMSGSGGNGKGLVDDLLLLALGQYGIIGNNSILFETSKMGSNPEKANIHKKRFVLFREPPEKNKFENSIIKELTGGGMFSARSHHEKSTEKELNLTMVVECNKRPLFSEEPTNAEVRRLIDLHFQSTFTFDSELVDEEKYIFLANADYKTSDFQNKHKYALIRILIDEHKKYKSDGYIFKIPKNVTERTQSYLEMSCSIVDWFKDNYKRTGKNSDICKVKDIYDSFTNSIYYSNLSRMEKRKYNKTYFLKYVEQNIFFKKYYVERRNNIRHIVKEWILKDEDE